MADSPQSTIADAIKPDGFVDFYQLINEPSSATTDQLKTRISSLYDEAQANRDHRNILKRRDYQLLLELLPQARKILLDDNKRARYDAYAAEARENRASLTFDQFINEVVGDASTAPGERVSVLGVQEADAKGAAGKATTGVKPVPPMQGSDTAKSGARASNPLPGIAISLIVAVIAYVVVRIPAHQGLPSALGAAALAAILTFIIAHLSLGARTRV
jgi:hypothetical protein